MNLAKNAMTTLETALSMLDIPLETADERTKTNIIFLINSASAWVERICDRKFALSEYTEKHMASGSQNLLVKQYPIRSVLYVKNDQIILDSDSYNFIDDSESGIIFRENGWPYRGYRAGLANDIIAHSRCIEVKYTAGYSLPWQASDDDDYRLPYDLEALIIGMVCDEYVQKNNGSYGLSAFSISDISWTFDKSFKQSFTETINRYRRIGR